jgi:hypothetical protein
MTVNPARHGPFPGRMAPDAVSAYAAATGDDTPSVLCGQSVPATFPVILVFDAVQTARAEVPADAWARVRGGVHGEHLIVLHRHLAPSDWSDHHFDIEAARDAGFDFVFVHGLCTMAICTHRLLDLLGVDDPGSVARVAVRFASPTPLGCDLTVNAFGVDDHCIAFEAAANGTTTITHGRLELRS